MKVNFINIKDTIIDVVMRMGLSALVVITLRISAKVKIDKYFKKLTLELSSEMIFRK